MPDEILTKTKEITAENSYGSPVEAKTTHAACQMQHKVWLKGGLSMALCCAAPLLIVGVVAFFGLSLGALASGLFTTAALLACPVVMFLMMRMMMKDKK